MIITRQNIIFNEKGIRQETHLSLGRFNNEIESFKYILSPDETEIFNSFKVDSRRNEFIAGRLLAKKAAQSYHTDLPLNHINIASGVWGFPVFTTHLFAGMCISIAHTRNYAGSFLSGKNTHPIGIDIEEINLENTQALKNFLSDYDSLSLDELHLYWAAKEAASKCLKTGFIISPSIFTIEYMNTNEYPYSVLFRFLKNITARCWIVNNLVICLCYPAEWEIVTKDLKFESI